MLLSRRPALHDSGELVVGSNPILTRWPLAERHAAEKVFRWKMDGSGGEFLCQEVRWTRSVPTTIEWYPPTLIVL